MFLAEAYPRLAFPVRRLLDEVMVGGDFEALPELVAPEVVEPTRRRIKPFRRSLPDSHMEILTVVVDDENVAARFRCSGRHLGP
jgi:SnoaL-like polyketide cyclase